ncbi:hypothetical protein QE109_12035 [Fusibacter bizertensis]|uniref:Uncharacterized protein n=1 Tax=Fusibacter bizertensis TaxID=1488331 RepID=A0ABT6NEP2_9FIRM|nr:DUF6648 family protein [Fusibacter bizertensis]MDH8678885.1 hypothetical protein [Fusibacter bizertensis]
MKEFNSKEIEAFCQKRIELITLLEQGQLTKENFIIENYELMSGFKRVNYQIESIEEGILKYHYFNTMAKKLMLEADAIEFKDYTNCVKLKDRAYDFYSKKDKITLSMLEKVEFKEVEAYFIHMNSRTLEGQIYEIRFNNYEKVVLHSKDRKILYKLRETGCFSDEPIASVIADYVNTKIY